MLVSELIRKLEANKKAFGDVEVNVHAKTALVENMEVEYSIQEDKIIVAQV